MTKGKKKVVVEEEEIDVEAEYSDDDFVEAKWNKSGKWYMDV